MKRQYQFDELEQALRLAIAVFPVLDSELDELTIEMPSNFGELDVDTLSAFRLSRHTQTVRLLASPKRTLFREIVLQSSGKTLSKILDTSGLDFADMRFVPLQIPQSAPLEAI